MLWKPRRSAAWAISMARPYISREVRADGDCIRRKVPKYTAGIRDDAPGHPPRSSRSQAKELARVVDQQAPPHRRRQAERLERAHRIVDAHPERIVAAQHDALGPEGLERERGHPRGG